MIIRDGFVTNSSSTNFMIISKQELTSAYLLKKLGFKEKSSISSAAVSLVEDIIRSTESGVRWFDVDRVDYETVLMIFGSESAEKYKALSEKGFHTYLGHTSSENEALISFLTMDSFVIDEKDFYMDGKNCGW